MNRPYARDYDGGCVNKDLHAAKEYLHKAKSSLLHSDKRGYEDAKKMIERVNKAIMKAEGA